MGCCETSSFAAFVLTLACVDGYRTLTNSDLSSERSPLGREQLRLQDYTLLRSSVASWLVAVILALRLLWPNGGKSRTEGRYPNLFLKGKTSRLFPCFLCFLKTMRLQ